METRNIYDTNGSVIGSVSLPTGTGEIVWEKALSGFRNSKPIEELKAEMISAFEVQTRDFIFYYYPVEKQISLAIYLLLAKIDGMTNRYEYIGQALAWAESVLTHHFEKCGEIDAAETTQDLDAISLDLTPFASTEPNVSLQTAMGIID